MVDGAGVRLETGSLRYLRTGLSPEELALRLVGETSVYGTQGGAVPAGGVAGCRNRAEWRAVYYRAVTLALDGGGEI